MKSLRYILVSAVALLALVSCTTKEDPFTPGNPTNSNGNNIYFSAENPDNVVLGLADNSFTVTLERENANAAVSVPLTAFSTSSVFSVPSSVDFAAGETSKDITVQFSGAEPFVNYVLSISLPEEFTYPYKDQNVYPTFSVSVLQEDFKVVHTGTYYDDFWYEESWEQDLEYSELSETYRLSNLWTPGYGFTFKWDGKGSEKVTVIGGKMSTGIVHSTYGLISATPGDCFYDADDDAIYFPFTWTVSAGSFGTYYNVFYF
ncbi:MAG: hypothetical protein IJ636_05935 [Bacteroidales bacterium]|nr:hypothetical protein [Bacteroidales bacterium]